jgi:hypothetical protein
MWLFPLGAAAVSAVFAGSLLAQWTKRHRPNVAAWSVALGMFAIASFAPAVGMLRTWTPAWFRIYYLFGAVVNVPVLGLGTIYLLGPRKLGNMVAALVVVACVAASAIVWRTHIDAVPLHTNGIPKGSEVVSPGVRMLARVYSFAGFFVVVGGALWSSYRLLGQRQDHLRRLAAANGLIAGGTFIVALGSGFAFYGRGVPFAVGLFVGVCVMFWGFLKTRARPPAVRAG